MHVRLVEEIVNVSQVQASKKFVEVFEVRVHEVVRHAPLFSPEEHTRHVPWVQVQAGGENRGNPPGADGWEDRRGA